MPVSPEKASRTVERRISKAERVVMVDEIMAESKLVFDPKVVLSPMWEGIFPYATLIAMMRRLQQDTSFQPHQLAHLRKITAWKAVSMKRSTPRVMNREAFWREVDEEVGPEINAIKKLPPDLQRAPAAYKNAFSDRLKIDGEWLEPQEQ